MQNKSERLTLKFNNDWRFFRGDVCNASGQSFNDSHWEVVQLPHTVRIEPADCSGGKNYRGIAWYRKHFFIDKDFSNKKIFIEFEGAKIVADVWLNGKHITTHYGGYLPFTIDISNDVIVDGTTDNVIAVKLDNTDAPDVPPGKPQADLDFCYFGGIYRNVWMHVTDKLHVTDAVYANEVAGGGIFVTYPKVSDTQAELHIKTHVINENSLSKNCCIKTTIYNSTNETITSETTNACNIEVDKIKTFEQSININHPILWHPNHPYLYTVYTEVFDDEKLVDNYRTKIGIRTINFNGKGFYINGEPFKIVGANRHQEYVYIGDAVPDSMHRRDAIKLKEAGFDFIRVGHYPQSPAFMDACDELGLMCVVPTPGWQWFPNTEDFKQRSYQDIRDMIRRDRNHPCVILWEPILNESDYSEEYAKTAYNITHEEYPGDQCYAGCDSYRAYAEHYDVIYGNRTRNVSPEKAIFLREYGDNYREQFGPQQTLKRCSRGTKGFYSGGEKAMLQSALERMIQTDKVYLNNQIAGCAVWTGIDCNRGYINNIAATGVLDLYRLPKFSYYMYKSQRAPHVNVAGTANNPIVFIANDWQPSSSNDVVVFGNCDKVKLYLNGRLIDIKQADSSYIRSEPFRKIPLNEIGDESLSFDKKGIPFPPFVFENIPFEKGELKAEGLINNEVVATHCVKTPKVADHLTLSADSCGIDLVANANDVMMVHAFIRDADDTIVPDAYNKITFNISGPGEIIGDEDTRVGSNPINAEAGAIGVLIRSTKEEGIITITASSPGLKSAKLKITSKKCTDAFVPGAIQVPPVQKIIYEVDTITDEVIYNYINFNIAYNKPVSASSELENYSASAVLDNQLTTRWCAKDASVPQWIKVDLEQPYDVTGCKIWWESDNTDYSYIIEVSKDNLTWTKMLEKKGTGQDIAPDKFLAERVRYIKITVTNVTKGVPSIYNLGIYGVNI